MKGDIPSTPLLYTRPPFCNDLCDEEDDDSDDDVDDDDDDDDDDDEVGVSYNRQRVDGDGTLLSNGDDIDYDDDALRSGFTET